jgi:hypothetical protein
MPRLVLELIGEVVFGVRGVEMIGMRTVPELEEPREEEPMEEPRELLLPWEGLMLPRELEPRELEPRELEPRELEPRELEPRELEPREEEPRELLWEALEP